MRYIVFLAAILLSGCAWFSKGEPSFGCPRVGLLPDAARVSFLSEDGETLISEAVIHGLGGSCSFKNKGEAEVELILPFYAKRGAADPALKTQELSYFISILSPDEEPLQREAFSTKVDFDETGIGTNTEEHTLKIPLPAPDDARKYKVAVGFVLTHDQLEHNRKKK